MLVGDTDDPRRRLMQIDIQFLGDGAHRLLRRLNIERHLAAEEGVGAGVVRSAALVKRQLPRTTFLIVGEGERSKEIAALVEKEGLADSVIMAGFRHDVLELIEIMDVFVSTSAYEGMGTSTLDAMFRGKPV